MNRSAPENWEGLRWIGPREDDWLDGSQTKLREPVPPERWPYGPPWFHEDGCGLHDRGLFCDCLASAVDGEEWGEGSCNP